MHPTNHPSTPETPAALRAVVGKRAGIVGIVLNALLFAGKLSVGLLFGTLSVVADAINNLSDVSSSVVSLLGFKLSEKPADREHPYGHGRYEYLAGLTVAFLIMAIGVTLARSGIEKILVPSQTAFSWLTVGMLAAAIAVKLVMMRYYRRCAAKIDSETLRAAAFDCRNDSITSAAVILAALVSHFADIDFDGWMCLAVAAFILYSGFGLVRDTIDPLLGHAPDPAFVAHIQRKILDYPGVLSTHDLIVHDYGPGRIFASAHVEMAAEEDVCISHDVIDNIERDFWEDEGLHIILHYDPILTQDEQVGSLRSWLAEEVKIVDETLTIHDLRLVVGPTHTNLIFDTVVPPDFSMTDGELRAAIGTLVRKTHPDYRCVITIDRSYAAL